MKKFVISGGLFLAAILWVGVLSLLTRSGSEETVSVPAADGSQATIQLIDKSQFYKDNEGQIALQMAILGPDQQPIPGLSPKNLRLKEEGIPVPVKSFQGPGMQAINVFLVIDVSGSMGEGLKMEEARQAALSAVDELRVDRDRIGVIAFDDRFDVIHPLSELTTESKSRCRESLQRLQPRGGTLIGPPTLGALDLFKQSEVEGAKLLMVMTDGEDEQLPDRLEQIAGASDAGGVPVFAIAFGSRHPLAEQVLRDLASRCSGEYYFAPTGEKLAEIYRSRVQDASEQFLITYNSPWPDDDGLSRQIQGEIETPSGTLEASGQYQIGPIIAGGIRKAPRVAAIAGDEPIEASGGGSKALQIVMFLVLLCVLSGGLVASELSPQLRSRLGTVATAPEAPVSNRPLVSPKPAPPPPKRPTLPGRTTSSPAAVGQSPTTTPPAVGGKVSGTVPPPPPVPRPVAPATPSSQPSVTKKTPPPPAARGTQKISPIPPPPPPPGKKPQGE